MKIAGLFASNEIMAGMNKFLNKFDISVTYNMEDLLSNVSNINNCRDIEAIIIHSAARPKDQHRKLLYNIRAILPNVLLIWFCAEKDKDEQFEAWAFSAVNLKDIIYINENGEIPVNRLVETLTAEHARLVRSEEAKKLKQTANNRPLRVKPPPKEKIVKKVVEKKVIVEKEVIVDRPTVVKGLLKIATFSVSPGSGSTTMAVKMGKHLSQCGKTAVIEVDGSDSLQYAKPTANCDYRALKKPEELGDALYELYRSGYNITVTDYGCLFKINSNGSVEPNNQESINRVLLKEFIKADVKLGLTFTAPWQLEKLKFFAPGNEVFEGLCGKAYEELCFLTDGEETKAEKILNGIKCYTRDIDINLLVQMLLPDIAAPKQRKQQRQYGIFRLLPKIRGV
jgi:hypothetical protein